MHRPRRVAFRDVERGEIVPVVLDLRACGDGEAHVRKDFRQFVHHLADRVDRPARRLGRGQRQVHGFGGKAGIQRGAFQRTLALCQGIGNPFTQGVDQRAGALPFFGGHPAQCLEQGRDRTLLAQKFDPQSLQRAQILRGGDTRQRLFTGCGIVHGFGFAFILAGNGIAGL